jgi:hypothetical protein
MLNAPSDAFFSISEIWTGVQVVVKNGVGWVGRGMWNGMQFEPRDPGRYGVVLVFDA